MRRTDCLDLLGLDEAATADEIKFAYWRLAKGLHPDTNANQDTHDAFILVTKAYRQLRVVAPETIPVVVPQPPVRAAAAASATPRRRGGGRRWLGVATFFLTAAGVLLVAGATLRALDTASLEGGSQVWKAVATPAVPVPVVVHGVPAAQPVSAAIAIPPILVGRSARESSTHAMSPKPLIKAEPSRQTEPVRQASRAEPSPILRTVPQPRFAPTAPKPIAPRALAPIVRRQTIPTAGLPPRRAPLASRAGQTGRGNGVTGHDRIRQTRNEPTERRKTSVAPPPPVSPKAPPTSFEALTKPSLDLLRSALGVR